jgi:predicted patatin/cPLA2 family phospholipase
MKRLGGSGGGTKGAGILGAMEAIIKGGYQPTVIDGISVSAILAVPASIATVKPDMWDLMKDVFLNLKIDDFFSKTWYGLSKSPITEKGKLSTYAKICAVTGRPYFGDQGKLRDTIKYVVPKTLFLEWKSNTEMPKVIVGAVDIMSGARTYYNLKTVTYDKFIDAVQASASIPVFTKWVETVDGLMVDGGIRDHITDPEYFKEYKDIKESITIYSRPENKDISLKKIPKNWLDMVMRVIDIMELEISKSDERLENRFANEIGYTPHQIFLPSILEHVYDTDKQRLKQLYDAGYKMGEDILKNL